MAGTNAPIVDRIRIIPRAKEFLDRAAGSSGEVFFSKETNTLRIFSGRTANTGGFEVVTNASVVRNASAANLASIVYPVTVTGPQGTDIDNKFNLNSVYSPEIDAIVGYTYVFDQSDPTNVFYPNPTGGANNQHPLMFSADDPNGDTGSGTVYTNGVKYILDDIEVSRERYEERFQRATDRRVLLTVDLTTPETLYYYCSNHLNMGNTITVSMPGTGTGSASVTASDVAPEEPENGSVWFNSDTGRLYVYLVDVDSGQWVQPAIPLADSLLDLGISDGTNGQILSTDGAGNFSFIDAPSGGSSFDQTLNTTDDVVFNTIEANSFTNTGTGTSEIESATTLTLISTDGVVVQGGPLRLPSFTTLDRDALTPVDGDIILNITDNVIQAYVNGTWTNL